MEQSILTGEQEKKRLDDAFAIAERRRSAARELSRTAADARTAIVGRVFNDALNAALLRTLSKEHHRQILITVHDRPLFEYLTLELSPAFQGDRLITVELNRSIDGVSLAEPTFLSWEPDRAVAA
jgi:hypothetical protein